jgi:hypothetical protein
MQEYRCDDVCIKLCEDEIDRVDEEIDKQAEFLYGIDK